MKGSEACMLFERFGARIVNGLVVAGAYSHGRIGYEDLFLEKGEGTIPLDSLRSISAVQTSPDDIAIDAILDDGSAVRLPRSEYSEPKAYQGFIIDKDGSPMMPNDLSTLTDAWGAVFPEFNEMCWREVTTGSIVMDTSMIGESGVAELSDSIATRSACFLQRRLRDLGCKGRSPSKELALEVLVSLADKNRRNAFLEAMRGDIWDGRPRLDRLFIDVFGGQMLGLDTEESEKALSEVCRCWFLGGVARQFGLVQLDILPIMIGLPNVRKTSAVKWLAMEERFYQSMLSLTEKAFVEASKGKLVIELSEMNATRNTSNAYLKGFLSRSSDYLRMAYDRFATENYRRFVLIGTSNEYEMLTDPTGNRRYFPFEVDPGRACVGFGGFGTEEGQRYIRQVWSEAYQRYLRGEDYSMSQEAYELCRKAQEAAVINNPDVDLLSQLVDEHFPLPGDKLCVHDLVELLMDGYGKYEEESKRAAAIWWRIYHPEWGPSKQERLPPEGRKWAKCTSTSQKCRTRLHPRGYVPPASTKSLGD
ncbi:MAG: hypothetical protein IKG94_07340 [Candidatus Methanomethylophilaceae archaeon]|nr:hypothetical protein [Candidatus Methanomethylophilaceae archaeon]MBR6205195.1 hypothetical protein [Candidatus Methanomethylophilaceae archaeon]